MCILTAYGRPLGRAGSKKGQTGPRIGQASPSIGFGAGPRRGMTWQPAP